MDYTSFELAEARPELCREACFRDGSRCKSFTYFKPGVNGNSRARCFLKQGFPTPALDSCTTQTPADMGHASGLERPTPTVSE